MEIITISSQKGGVAKTTTSLNLAIGLANSGKRILLVDLDPQGSLTLSLGYNQDGTLEKTIANPLYDIINDNIEFDDNYNPNYSIIKYNDNIDLLPSDVKLASIEVSLSTISVGRESILKQYLKMLENNYDLAIIDTSPSLGMLTINALACASSVIIPVQAHYLATKGMEELIKTIIRVRKHINPNLNISGIIITMADMRTNVTKTIIDMIQKQYKDKIKVYDTIIPHSIKAVESTICGQSIYQYNPECKVAIAYTNFVSEVLENE